MNLTSLIVISPFTIVVAILLFAVVAVHYVLNVRAIREARLLRQKLIVEAKKRVKESFTVFFELDRKADTLIPALEALQAQNYPKLQIIILVKHTAGKNAARQINAAKRRTKLNLSVITHRRGMTNDAVLQRYAKGRYILPLTADMRLAPDFFSHASYAALTTRAGVIIPREVYRPTSRLTSGWLALRVLWTSLVRQFYRPKVQDLQPGMLVHTKSIQKGTFGQSVLPTNERLYINVSDRSVRWTQGLRSSIIALAIYAVLPFAVWGSFVLFEDSLVRFVLGLIAVLVLLSQLIFQLSVRGYRFIDHLSLFLLVPFVPFYHIVKSVKTIITKVRR